MIQFPHCDQRVLHAPGLCRYCDRHPEWQKLREKWGIAFTGQLPGTISSYGTGHDARGRIQRQYTAVVPPGEHSVLLPCPADFNRPPTGEPPDHRRWAGNVATSQAPVNESAASRMLYASPPVRREWTVEEAIEEARKRPGFIERLRGNIEKHRDLLDRLGR